MFIAAVFEFGKVDAIGHAPIIVVLLVIAADSAATVPKLRHSLMAPAAYVIALTASLALYYMSHTLLFGSNLT
jgi:hypothetical protein